MTYRGTVRNGVVVFDGTQPPPAEGTPVRVEPQPQTTGDSGGGTDDRSGESSDIYRHPRVCGGDACVGNTRIPVWSLVRYRQLGRTDAQLLADFPSLTALDLAAAWAYANGHRDEIEQALLKQAARDRVDAKLIQALDSGPGTDMTAQDWQDIREEGRKRAASRRKNG